MRRLRLVGLLILTALFGLWSLVTGVASVAAWQADRMSEGVPVPGVVAGGADDQSIRRLLSIARRLEPTNPNHDEQLAKHLEIMALQAPPRSAADRRWLTPARGRYVEAASRRPTWPLSLTSLLRTDLKLGRWDWEFTAVYARAADLGRSEPAALRALVDVGLAAWPVLEPDGRQAVLALLRHGLRLAPKEVLERAVALRQDAVVAPLIAPDPALARLYATLRAGAPHTP